MHFSANIAVLCKLLQTFPFFTRAINNYTCILLKSLTITSILYIEALFIRNKKQMGAL